MGLLELTPLRLGSKFNLSLGIDGTTRSSKTPVYETHPAGTSSTATTDTTYSILQRKR